MKRALLRALLNGVQEKEIERLGGKETVKVDLRIIAATNCNLEKEVAEGKFRLDLYYRLNIFPILLPTLRDRREDLPELAKFFVRKYAERAGKINMSLAPEALKELSHYDWPGNVRELEHLIERNALLSRGNMIEKIILPAVKSHLVTDAVHERIKTIHDNEREYILSILDLPSTTLNSKMKRLGITLRHIGG